MSLWCERVAATSDEKLNQALLATSAGGSGTLGVNFDPELVRLLRETKYFLLLKVEGERAGLRESSPALSALAGAWSV